MVDFFPDDIFCGLGGHIGKNGGEEQFWGNVSVCFYAGDCLPVVDWGTIQVRDLGRPNLRMKIADGVEGQTVRAGSFCEPRKESTMKMTGMLSDLENHYDSMPRASTIYRSACLCFNP